MLNPFTVLEKNDKPGYSEYESFLTFSDYTDKYIGAFDPGLFRKCGIFLNHPDISLFGMLDPNPFPVLIK
jgi:hypothetical protein